MHSRIGRFAWMAAGLLAFVLAGGQSAFAQTTGTLVIDQATMDQILKRLAELEKEIQVLRTQPPAPAHAEPAPAAETTKETQAGEMHDSMMMGGAGPLRIRGFGDVNFRGGQPGNHPNTFSVGPIDLFLSSKVAERFSVLGEIVFEPDDQNVWGIDAERMLLQYVANDYLNISAGRYHTAIGYYNAAFHHGTWFQTPAGRPFIFNFEDEGGLLPVHGVGLSVQGRIPSGSLGLRYVAEISNGRASHSPDAEAVQSVVDENRGKAVNVALMARPDQVPGLQAGVSVYRDRLTPDNGTPAAETITAAHVVFERSTFEWLNEALFIRHTPSGAAAMTTSTFYTQLSRQFGRYRPYVRYQFIQVPAADAYFGTVIGRLSGPSVGLKFDAAAAVALKIQIDRLFGPARDRVNGFTAQLAFTF